MVIVKAAMMIDILDRDVDRKSYVINEADRKIRHTNEIGQRR